MATDPAELKFLRQALGLSQAEVGALADPPIHQSHVARIESGERATPINIEALRAAILAAPAPETRSGEVSMIQVAKLAAKLHGAIAEMTGWFRDGHIDRETFLENVAPLISALLGLEQLTRPHDGPVS